ncbi:ABC transporter permease [Cellulomonas sp. PhB150]|uniref:ABC transporter permease n=1 Tax=Cellulomonas sp. PhB150 TaxID=2485188 RepID=UPI000F4766C6|nr:ABC transporter permease [Cellulomonas sp. PhB150]ROS31282.1 ABC-2 type transport system permease protein [Cellulomonas sp. PhB150]
MSADRSLGSGAAIRLVAGREIRTRLASKAFIWLTLAFVVIVVLGGLLFKLTGSSSDPQQVAVTADAAAVADQVEATATGVGVEVVTREVPDRAAGEKLLSSGDADALVVATSPTLEIVVKQDLSDQLGSVFGSLAQQLALSSAVTDLGGDPAEVGKAVATAAPTVTALEPEPERDGGQIAAGVIVGILLFIALMNAGQLVAQGVVEEKTSRVVELLLATLRPWQLMAGKVLGIGVVGLVQLVLIVGAAVASSLGFGVLDSSSLDVGAIAVWALVWFVVGFAMFALVLAALAALVSRQEDIGSVTGPVIALMIVPYIVGISIAPYDPESTIVVVMSFIPFAAPFIMPIRQALGAVEGWEVAVSLGLSIALIPVLVWLAGRVYSNAVLRAGGRVKLKDALGGR